ncbi:MAG: hypothetical protein QNJ54_00715 [Prochloraceae cyanobacterium]|nr:hypothetical protein [Prochloraceae cyanobacterium]
MPKRTKQVNIRLNDLEYEKLEKYAKKQQITMTEVIRDFIKGLPRDSSAR